MKIKFLIVALLLSFSSFSQIRTVATEYGILNDDGIHKIGDAYSTYLYIEAATIQIGKHLYIIDTSYEAAGYIVYELYRNGLFYTGFFGTSAAHKPGQFAFMIVRDEKYFIYYF